MVVPFRGNKYSLIVGEGGEVGVMESVYSGCVMLVCDM